MRSSVWLHSASRLLATHRALIPGALAGYAVLFGFLIYGLAVHARLESWREPHLPASAGAQTPAPIPREARAACAEFSGMGQAPCNMEGKVEVAHAEFRAHFAAPEVRDIQPPVEQAIPASHPYTPILLVTEEFPDGGDEDELLAQDEPPNLSIAYLE